MFYGSPELERERTTGRGRDDLFTLFGMDFRGFRRAEGRLGWGVIDSSGVVWFSPDGLRPPERDDLLVEMLRASGSARGLYVEMELAEGGRPGELASLRDAPNCQVFTTSRTGEGRRLAFLLTPLADLDLPAAAPAALAC